MPNIIILANSVDLIRAEHLQGRKNNTIAEKPTYMNYSKGFTRVWIALSLAWVFGVICYHFDDIKNPKIAPYHYLYSSQNKAYIDITGDAELVRRLTKNKDYQTHTTLYSEHYIYAAAEQKGAVEAMTVQSNAEDVTFRKSLYNSARTSAIWSLAIYAILPILVLLATIFGVKWVSTGFQRPEPPKRLW